MIRSLSPYAIPCVFACALSACSDPTEPNGAAGINEEGGYRPPPKNVNIVSVLPKESKAESEEMRRKLMLGEWWDHPFPLTGKLCAATVNHVGRSPRFSYKQQFEFDDQGRIKRFRSIGSTMGGLSLFHYQDNRVIEYRRNLTTKGKLAQGKSKIVGSAADWTISEFSLNNVWRWAVTEGDSPEEMAAAATKENAKQHQFNSDYEIIDPTVRSKTMRLDRRYTKDGYLEKGLLDEYTWNAERTEAVYELGFPFTTIVIAEQDAKGNPLRIESIGKKNTRAVTTYTYDYCDEAKSLPEGDGK